VRRGRRSWVTLPEPTTGRLAMSREKYLRWHDGVEFDTGSQTWRGYIEDNDYTEKHLTEESFEDKGDAVVAAGKMLAAARHGSPPA
jgi:hypothetical protein